MPLGNSGRFNLIKDILEMDTFVYTYFQRLQNWLWTRPYRTQ